MITGPLTTSAELPNERLFGTNAEAAEWLVHVGPRGGFAWVRPRTWARYDPRSGWAPCQVEEVHRAVRRVLGPVYDAHMDRNPSTAEVLRLMRLMDVNWRLGPLMQALRKAASVPALAMGRPTKLIQPSVRCRSCGVVSSGAGAWSHQRLTRCKGTEEAA